MKRTWLLFSQAVTVLVAAWFVVATLQPQWLGKGNASIAGVSVTEAPANSLPRGAVGAAGSGMGFSSAAKIASAAVVSINTSKAAAKNPHGDDPWFKFFFGEQGKAEPQGGLGSGVIISSSGYILTNNHVVEGADEIEVILNDTRKAKAKVIGTDPDTDLAILKIDLDKLPAIVLGDSDTLQVGDPVLAIGNPFGVGQTVTQGIVSGLARSEIGQSEAQVFIQTDAAINPGNSGGALVDMAGRVVGINTAIFSKSGGSHGIGFAIPSNMVRLYVDSALAGRKVERPWLGARFESVTRDVAAGLGLERVSGALIARVYDNSPASAAGLQSGDVVTAIDGFDVADARGALYRLTTRGIGNRAELKLVRKGRPQTVSVDLKAAPNGGKDEARNLSGVHPFDGARVVNLSPALADELGQDEITGVVILSIRPGSTAQRLGFEVGDLIAQVGRDAIGSVADLEKSIATRQRLWSLAVKRGGRLIKLQVQG